MAVSILCVGAVGGDLSGALTGIDVAVYLVHSIGDGADWEEVERRDAENIARYAAAARVRRIVYLGGLGRRRRRIERSLAESAHRSVEHSHRAWRSWNSASAW